MGPHRTLLWFRQDLRLADNPALLAASARGAVIPVFLWTPGEEGEWAPGSASRWWLHHSLLALADDIAARGGALIVRGSSRASALELLRELLRQTGADGVCWNRRYEPVTVARDEGITDTLRREGVHIQSCNGSLLEEPCDVRNKAGRPFQVFTAYWRRALQVLDPAPPLVSPARWPGARMPSGTGADARDSIAQLGLLPRGRWHLGLADTWRPGEAGAWQRLETFLAGPAARYDVDRDRPDIEGTSRLSPHLHFGELSPRQVWHAVLDAQPPGRAGATALRRDGKFLTELGWREFSYHLLHHFPHTTSGPLRPEFAHFPWVDDSEALEAWQRGRTGIPIVDAGLRQLWHEGWMHNRVRMIAASLLVKNLQVNWLHGARWFWDTLVDADLACNTLGWQWVAGSGADAAPFFRIFNPDAQRARFDPQGRYVRRWVPDAATPGYPAPIVNATTSRIAALASYEQMRRAGSAE